jgi:hypothetical protein
MESITIEKCQIREGIIRHQVRFVEYLDDNYILFSQDIPENPVSFEIFEDIEKAKLKAKNMKHDVLLIRQKTNEIINTGGKTNDKLNSFAQRLGYLFPDCNEETKISTEDERPKL